MPPNNLPHYHVNSKSSHSSISRSNFVKSFARMLGIDFLTSFGEVWMDEGPIIMASEPQIS